MSNTRNADQTVRHKLQIHFDLHECQFTPEALSALADDLDPLAMQAGNFPVADVRARIEWNGRNNEYVVKLSLILPGETLVTSDHDAVVHAAFHRALDSLERALESYKGRLGGVDARQKMEEAGKLQAPTTAGPVDEAALDAAAAARDYPAFRAAITPYEDWLRLRVGRWVERYPDVQARMMGRDFDVLDLMEGVFLAAFEQHARRHAEVRYRDWLEGLIDPTIRDFARDPVGERQNVNLARSACAAATTGA
jgi:ribosome-associated translation inhibitor RaiA